MNAKRYWFPVRPARDGWGWGLPLVWQGWAVYLAMLVLLMTGISAAVPYGALATIGVGCAVGLLFLAIVWWKGEPHSVRDRSSP